MSSSDSENPFLSPVSDISPNAVEETDVERIRKKYLSHEASIKSVGFLYLLGAAFLGVIAVITLVATVPLIFQSGVGASQLAMILGINAIYVLLTGLQGWVGWGLRKLDSSVRIAGILLGVIGLLGFPIGTIISGYIIYLLASRKGRYVMSDEYREVISQTPHIKYKTSIIVWVFVGLLLAVILFAVIAVTIDVIAD